VARGPEMRSRTPDPDRVKFRVGSIVYVAAARQLTRHERKER
jgi:hypothetical protein